MNFQVIPVKGVEQLRLFYFSFHKAKFELMSIFACLKTHSCAGRNKYVEHDKMEPLAFYYFIFQLALLSVFMHKIKTFFNLFRFKIKLLFLLEQFDKIEWIQKENLFLLKSGVRLVQHFSFDLNLFIYSINYLSRDFHFAHQGFSNFVCKMYVQFNK